jgi:hypothetical protein
MAFCCQAQIIKGWPESLRKREVNYPINAAYSVVLPGFITKFVSSVVEKEQ